MTKLRRLIIFVVAGLSSIAQVEPQAVAPGSTLTAKAFLHGCKDFVAGRSTFFGGRCAGAVDILNAFNAERKAFCPPAATNNLQRVRIIVAFIEARPDRANEDFSVLANEAMAQAWPCKN